MLGGEPSISPYTKGVSMEPWGMPNLFYVSMCPYNVYIEDSYQ